MGKASKNLVSYSSPPLSQEFSYNPSSTFSPSLETQAIQPNTRGALSPSPTIDPSPPYNSALISDSGSRSIGNLTPEPFLASLYQQYKSVLYLDTLRFTATNTTINLQELAKLSWKGIPVELRAECWKYLFDYYPIDISKRISVLAKRRQEYQDLLRTLDTFSDSPNKSSASKGVEEFSSTNKSLPSVFDYTLYHQIDIDLPRTQPGVSFFSSPFIQGMMRRILYFWAIRHPASGYIQGLNDLLTPILFMFTADWVMKKFFWKSTIPYPHNTADSPSPVESADQARFDLDTFSYPNLNATYSFYYEQIISLILSMNHGKCAFVQASDLDPTFSPELLSSDDTIGKCPHLWIITVPELLQLESDIFWCFTRLLEPLQNRYTLAQPSLFKEIQFILDLILKIDPVLAMHFQSLHVDLTVILFRWLNCLCLRELPFLTILRLWDTCLAECIVTESQPLVQARTSVTTLKGSASQTALAKSLYRRNTTGFQIFYTYFIVAFLRSWSKWLLTLDFQESMLFLQNLPTKNWDNSHIQILTSEAFLLKELFHNASSHLK